DQYPGQQPAHHQHNAYGNLEIQRFLALLVNERIQVLLQLPDDQRPQHIADHRHDEPGEGGVVTEHGPATSLDTGLRNQGLIAHRKGFLQSASAARCKANSSSRPLRARASMALSSSGWNGAPSAVPCTSIKPPASVMTTLRSVSAAESSR